MHTRLHAITHKHTHSSTYLSHKEVERPPRSCQAGRSVGCHHSERTSGYRRTPPSLAPSLAPPAGTHGRAVGEGDSSPLEGETEGRDGKESRRRM